MTNHFQLIQDMVKCLAGIDVHRIRRADESILKLIAQSPYGAVRTAIGDRAILRVFRNMRPDCIYEINGILNVCYLAIYNGEQEHYLVVGPCLTEQISDAEIRLQLRRFGMPQEHIQMMKEFVRQQSVVPYETLHQLGDILASHLNGIPSPVPYQRVDYQWDSNDPKDLMLVDHYEDLGRMRQVEHRYEISAALTEAVKQGNLSLAYRMTRQMNVEISGIVRNPNPLRNAQNLCIILNTQLRHAMEDTGIHPYVLDRFSHEIALQIEKLLSVRAADRFSQEIVRRYCELARDHAYPDLKPFARLAVTYIKEHLSDNLTVKGTAKALMVNANYLSDQFHKEMGMTFIDFVNRERTMQAASLLKHTNLQIQQIAAAVGYNNTSYFAKQFVRFCHMTPRSFRNSGPF